MCGITVKIYCRNYKNETFRFYVYSSEPMEIDGDPAALLQGQTTNKRRKLNTTSSKILVKPAIGGALLPDDKAIVIDTQFFDDPFGISREEVCS